MRGITKVRNEAHIIEDTLDLWADICTDGIHVLDDCSTDGTAQKCAAHPGVVEVMRSNYLDPDRLRAEWYNRNLALNSAKRFIDEGEWIAYFDADEHPFIENFKLFEREDVDALALELYDVYITPEDVNDEYHLRQWVGPEKRTIPFFFRLRPWSAYFKPDQRIMHHRGKARVIGRCKHYGKGYSVGHFEKKCDYYADVFGKYGPKWAARKGKAIHTRSDDGNHLIRFGDKVDGGTLLGREQ
jgi:glycosyltransferase involved in cell wall biosynthesis